MSDEQEKDSEKIVQRDEHGRIVSGVNNPAGKPKGTKQLTTKLREALDTVFEFKDKSTGEMVRERADVLLAKRLLQKAVVDLDPALLKLVFNYSEGMPPQSLDLTTLGEKVTKIEWELVEHGGTQVASHERLQEKPAGQ